MEREQASPTLSLRLLGSFGCADASGRPLSLTGRRARAILAYLAIDPHHAATRDKLCGLFWADRSDAQARSSLRQCLLELRTALGPAAESVLTATRSEVALVPGSVRSDVGKHAGVNGTIPPSEIASALDSLGADGLLDDLELGGPFGEWRDRERARFERMLAGQVAMQLDGLAEAQAWSEVVALAEAWLRRDPLDEAAIAHALRAELAMGASAAAQRRYDIVRKLLWSELAIYPGATIEQAMAMRPAPLALEPQLAKPARAEPASEPVLAVLAFDNLSVDPEMDFFSEGVAEEILNLLARSTGIKVLARSSSFVFRGRDKLTGIISSRLGATHFLDGAVRRNGDRLRVSAALVDCDTQVTLWSDQYNRELADVFVLQDDIAAAVALGLEGVFKVQRQVPALAPAVYDRYLRARGMAGSPADKAQCAVLLEGVVAEAPGFAPAWASLAMVRAIAARSSGGTDAFEAARGAVIAAAERSIALDSQAGLPLVALSLLEAEHTYATREGLLIRAAAASPYDAEVLKHLGDFEGSVGRIAASRETTLRAATLDPMNPLLATNAAVALSDMGAIDEAYAEFDTIAERWPDVAWINAGPLMIAALLRDWDRAERFFDRRGSNNEYLKRALSTADLLLMPLDTARTRLLGIVERNLADHGIIELGLLITMSACGLLDEAFDAVVRADFGAKRGQMPGGLYLTSIIFGATNKAMRADPRFLGLCSRLGLCQYWTTTGNWPDCADEPLGYDFRVEAARTVVSAPTMEMQP